MVPKLSRSSGVLSIYQVGMTISVLCRTISKFILQVDALGRVLPYASDVFVMVVSQVQPPLCPSGSHDSISLNISMKDWRYGKSRGVISQCVGQTSFVSRLPMPIALDSDHEASLAHRPVAEASILLLHLMSRQDIVAFWCGGEGI